MVTLDVAPSPLGQGPEAEGVVDERFAEEMVGAGGAGEDAVDGEVADLLEVADVHGDCEDRHGGGEGVVGGEEPPAGDLDPLPGEQQGGGEVVGAGTLEGYEPGRAGAGGSAAGEVEAVGLAHKGTGGDDG
ncbi:hypothetical protein [Streptomyces clavuligerus]|uniref:hypothetical protein n=1 Tax=Streptomyces clavuligerus TaxID=1901 RepID=UPI001F085DA7|nr:hypothetical protein [Streptomyces clavuligerus]